ncbi:serine/threonine-protein kinase [Streptomyces sp. NPDC007872]|uniref:serine/threonine-protein kinase n=1 Tax=Streptomyces sp. NPDC007872 TaxID=3364782 RepID=UPI0036C449A3
MGLRDGTRRIGQFTVVRTLGGGGMGKVYLCRTPAGQRLAVKVIRRELADLHDIRLRFAREVKALRAVHSPYTVPVYDAETAVPPLWLATRYVDGPTLEARVSTAGPLPLPEAAGLGGMLAEALSEVHARGVIHRDLKPSNIILERGEPRLIDFGIARSATARGLTLPGTVLGTHGYMAPEQLLGREPTPAVDVFALGAVLTYAATGRPPFGTGTAASGRIARGDRPRLARVPAPLAEVVAACLAGDPAARPLPADLTTALGALLAEEPTAGRVPEPGPVPVPGPVPGPVPVPRRRTEPVSDPPHRCHVPAPGGAADPCALRPVAARLLGAGMTRSLIRKAVEHGAR